MFLLHNSDGQGKKGHREQWHTKGTLGATIKECIVYKEGKHNNKQQFTCFLLSLCWQN